MRMKKNRPHQGAKRKFTLVSKEKIFIEIFRKKIHPREGDETPHPLKRRKKSPLTKLPTPSLEI